MQLWVRTVFQKPFYISCLIFEAAAKKYSKMSEEDVRKSENKHEMHSVDLLHSKKAQ